MDTGWYATHLTHTPSNQSYLTTASAATGTEEYRSFFVFDLFAVTDPILGATLRAYNPGATVPGDSGDGFSSFTPTAFIFLYDVTTDISALTAGTAGSAGFDDLGTGAVLGSHEASSADNGTLVSIPLNATAVANLNAATGLFALGGAMDTPVGGGYRVLFQNTGGPTGGSVVSNTTRQLVLETSPSSVPLPTAGALGILGLSVLAGLSRWSRRHCR